MPESIKKSDVIKSHEIDFIYNDLSKTKFYTLKKEKNYTSIGIEGVTSSLKLENAMYINDIVILYNYSPKTEGDPTKSLLGKLLSPLRILDNLPAMLLDAPFFYLTDDDKNFAVCESGGLKQDNDGLYYYNSPRAPLKSLKLENENTSIVFENKTPCANFISIPFDFIDKTSNIKLRFTQGYSYNNYLSKGPGERQSNDKNFVKNFFDEKKRVVIHYVDEAALKDIIIFNLTNNKNKDANNQLLEKIFMSNETELFNFIKSQYSESFYLPKHNYLQIPITSADTGFIVENRDFLFRMNQYKDKNDKFFEIYNQVNELQDGVGLFYVSRDSQVFDSKINKPLYVDQKKELLEYYKKQYGDNFTQSLFNSVLKEYESLENVILAVGLDAHKFWLSYNDIKESANLRYKRDFDAENYNNYLKFKNIINDSYIQYQKHNIEYMDRLKKQLDDKSLSEYEKKLSNYFRYQRHERAQREYKNEMNKIFGYHIEPSRWCDQNNMCPDRMAIERVIRDEAKKKFTSQSNGIEPELTYTELLENLQFKKSIVLEMAQKNKDMSFLKNLSEQELFSFNYSYSDFIRYQNNVISNKASNEIRETLNNYIRKELNFKIYEDTSYLTMSNNYTSFISNSEVDKLLSKHILNKKIEEIAYAAIKRNDYFDIFYPIADVLIRKKLID